MKSSLSILVGGSKKGKKNDIFDGKSLDGLFKDDLDEEIEKDEEESEDVSIDVAEDILEAFKSNDAKKLAKSLKVFIKLPK